MLTPPAHAADAWLMGSRWKAATAQDKKPTDTSLGAELLGRDLRAIHYRTTVVQHPVMPARAFDASRSAAVWGVLGHMSGGYALTGEPRGFLIAGIAGLNYANTPGSRAWSDLPDFALDGVRLAILGGCKSAVRDPSFGSFLDQGRRLGADSVIGFRRLISIPTTRTLSYGNLFWARFGAYVRSGASVSTAMQRARADLHRRTGRDWGYDSYAIAGAAPRPGSVRLRPARPGTRQAPPSPPPPGPTAPPPGPTAPPPASTALSVASDGVRIAEAAKSGPVRLSEASARAAGERQVSHDVSWFSREGMSLTSQRPVSHLPGEKLLALTFRSRLGAVAGPASAEVEVDRRTGRVVYASAARIRPRAVIPRVGRDQAIAAARRAIQAPGPATSATPEVWDGPRWVVEFADAEAVVDGRTGSVLAVADPNATDSPPVP